MIENNFIVNLFSQSAGGLTDTKRKESVNSKNLPDFVSALNNAVDKNSSARSNINIQRRNNYNFGNGIDKSIENSAKADGQERNNKIKSFKDVARENGQISSKKEIGSKSKNAKLDKAKKDIEGEAAIIEESLAGVLNISVEELRKILDTLNLSSEDLTDLTKTAEISQKISELFGLNNEQSATLAKITDFIVKEANGLMGDLDIQNNQNNGVDKEGWIKLEGVDVEVVENFKNLNLEKANELGDKLKESLNSLESKLESEPEKLFEAISGRIKELTESVNSESGIKDEFEDVKAVELEDSLEPKVSKSLEENTKSEEKDSTSRNDAQETQTASKGIETTNNIQPSQSNEFANIVNNQQFSVNEVSDVSKVQAENNVSRKEIIAQIVDKAKAVLTDEKSEMVIDLKPDHLGKLSLKVVTERGTVVAKFVAENEQVKATIESNMDNLKESLTRQGFSIQDFSVSVRQDSKKGFAEGQEFSQKGSRANKGEKISTVGVSVIEENNKISNPYMVNNSTINLMA